MPWLESTAPLQVKRFEVGCRVTVVAPSPLQVVQDKDHCQFARFIDALCICRKMSSYTTNSCWKWCCVDRNILNIIYEYSNFTQRVATKRGITKWMLFILPSEQINTRKILNNCVITCYSSYLKFNQGSTETRHHFLLVTNYGWIIGTCSYNFRHSCCRGTGLRPICEKEIRLNN